MARGNVEQGSLVCRPVWGSQSKNASYLRYALVIVGPGDATRVRVIGSENGRLLIEDRAGSKSIINKHNQIWAGRRSTQQEREILTEHRDAKVGSFCDWEHRQLGLGEGVCCTWLHRRAASIIYLIVLLMINFWGTHEWNKVFNFFLEYGENKFWGSTVDRNKNSRGVSWFVYVKRLEEIVVLKYVMFWMCPEKIIGII